MPDAFGDQQGLLNPSSFAADLEGETSEECRLQIAARYRSCVAHLAAMFFVVFTGFSAVEAFATSLLPGPLGYVCLAAVHVMTTFAAPLGPWVVKLLRSRRAMLLALSPYVLVILGIAYCSWPDFKDDCSLMELFHNDLLGSILALGTFTFVGLAAPILWTGEGVYLAHCSQRFQQLVGLPSSDQTLEAFFYTVYTPHSVAGAVIASLILLLYHPLLPFLTPYLSAPQFLFLVLGAISAVGMFTCIFLPSGETSNAKFANASMKDTLAMTVQDSQVLLRVPMILYSGMGAGFVYGDYTKYGVKRALAYQWIGIIMAVYFTASVSSSYVWAKAASRWGREFVIGIATVLHCTVYLFFCIWDVAEAESFILSFAIFTTGAALFGLGMAAFLGQLTAAFKLRFDGMDHEMAVAMADYKLWQSIGFISQLLIAWMLGSHLRTKALVLLVVLALAFLSLMAAKLTANFQTPSSIPREITDFAVEMGSEVEMAEYQSDMDDQCLEPEIDCGGSDDRQKLMAMHPMEYANQAD